MSNFAIRQGALYRSTISRAARRAAAGLGMHATELAREGRRLFGRVIISGSKPYQWRGRDCGAAGKDVMGLERYRRHLYADHTLRSVRQQPNLRAETSRGRQTGGFSVPKFIGSWRSLYSFEIGLNPAKD